MFLFDISYLCDFDWWWLHTRCHRFNSIIITIVNIYGVLWLGCGVFITILYLQVQPAHQGVYINTIMSRVSSGCKSQKQETVHLSKYHSKKQSCSTARKSDNVWWLSMIIYYELTLFFRVPKIFLLPSGTFCSKPLTIFRDSEFGDDGMRGSRLLMIIFLQKSKCMGSTSASTRIAIPTGYLSCDAVDWLNERWTLR